MPKRPLIASIALTAALVVGGFAGFLLGVPGVSQAQTTVPTSPPTTAAPAPGTGPDNGPPQGGRGANCPHMNGQPGQTPSQGTDGSSFSNTSYM